MDFKFNHKFYAITVLLVLSGLFLFHIKITQSYGECSQYGIWATYNSLTDSCKCMSGYVFGKDILGNASCVSADQMCKDKYGFNSKYNSLNDSCECGYGYSLGKDAVGRTQCISTEQQCKDKYGYGSTYDSLSDICKCRYGYIFSEDLFGKTKCIDTTEYCHNKLGYNSTYNSLSDVCECLNGYVLRQKTIGGGNECVSCFTKYGLHSSYNSLNKKCECDSDYTLNDDNQCVEKQNNVYFILKELNTDEKQAIIKSESDYRYYLITYSSGCYASSIKRYLNDRIVVNLGIDFDVDRWDKIVLQDDDETCDITSLEKIDSDYTLKKEEEDSSPPLDFAIPPVTNNQTKVMQEQNSPEKRKTCSAGYALSLNKTECIKIPSNAHPVTDSPTDVWQCNEGFREVGNSCLEITDKAVVVEKEKNAISSQNTITTTDEQGAEQENKDNSNSSQESSVSINKNDKILSFIKSTFSDIPAKIGRVFKKIVNWFK